MIIEGFIMYAVFSYGVYLICKYEHKRCYKNLELCSKSNKKIKIDNEWFCVERVSEVNDNEQHETNEKSLTIGLCIAYIFISYFLIEYSLSPFPLFIGSFIYVFVIKWLIDRVIMRRWDEAAHNNAGIVCDGAQYIFKK